MGDIVAILFFIFLGFAFPELFSKQLNVKNKLIIKQLWVFHLFWGVFFYFFVYGDAIQYWNNTKYLTEEQFLKFLSEDKGTYFMYALNYIPSNTLSLSYFTGAIMYSLIGYMGMVYFYLVASKLITYNSTFKGYVLFPLLFFMPNLHFWSAGVGKDTILFFCIGMFSYGMLNIIVRMPLLILSLLLSYLVRPHITLFLVISFGLAYTFSQKISAGARIMITIVLIGVGIVILPTVMKYAKIEEASVDGFNKFSNDKAAGLSHKNNGSAIDISSYPLPLKVFTFLYRPFFFDIRSFAAVIASFENLALLLLTIQLFKNKALDTFKAAPPVIKGLLFFLIIGTLAFSQSLGNVGIMIRMRNMFLPGLLIYILWSFSYQRQLSVELKKKLLKKKIALTPIHND